MKTQKKNKQGLYLQKRNNRWKWMVGATAATAAGVTASQASTITINLVGNSISTTGSNLNADLTGDGHPDLTIANAYYQAYVASVSLNGVQARCHYVDGFSYFTASMRLGKRSAHFGFYRYPFTHSSGTRSLTGSIPIFFKDLHINGGAPTSGSLEVTVSPNEIQLDSFTYNDPPTGHGATVPDQGSSLALLAMGAGGVLALRRWRTARERC